MPGSPIRAFPENGVKHPDSIGVRMGFGMTRRGHSWVFRIWVNFRVKKTATLKVEGPEKMPAKTQYGAPERIIWSKILAYSGNRGNIQ